ncbi:MAG TPA: glycosyl hydrolase [Gemmatimonadaceae bacterium]|nr:glycosyl hydrolase [Gemmatimonadaceae bacterium]
MRRRRRLAVVGIALAVSFGVGTLLMAFSRATEGPIAATLGRIGTLVGVLEKRLADRVRAPGRTAALAWLTPYRTDAAWLRDPDVVLLGAYDTGLPHSLEGVLQLESELGTTFPLMHFYAAWGDKPDQRFPLRELAAIRQLGSIPVLTWEPWLTDFENTLHPHLPLRSDRDRGGLAAIAAGAYDFYIDAWAAEAARFGTPILVRLAHEMNDSYRYPWGPHNNRPEEFIAAWERVVTRFRQRGATNVLWVWSPHLAYEYVEYYYPGDSLVDWVATGALNYGTVAQWADWYDFEAIFGEKYPQLARYGKPIMIAEFGSLAVGGDRGAWYRDALTDLPRRHTLVKGLMFFNVSTDQTVTLQTLDWSVTGDSLMTRTIREAIAPWAPPFTGQ